MIGVLGACVFYSVGLSISSIHFSTKFPKVIVHVVHIHFTGNLWTNLLPSQQEIMSPSFKTFGLPTRRWGGVFALRATFIMTFLDSVPKFTITQ